MSFAIGAVLVILLGALLAWWAWLCSRGMFRRQRVIGYRTPLTLRDDQAWIQVHRAFAPTLLVAAVGCIMAGVGALVLFVAGLNSAAQVAVGAAPAWVLVWMVIGFLPTRRAAKSYATANVAE
jgi:hypothetical protein